MAAIDVADRKQLRIREKIERKAGQIVKAESAMAVRCGSGRTRRHDEIG